MLQSIASKPDTRFGRDVPANIGPPMPSPFEQRVKRFVGKAAWVESGTSHARDAFLLTHTYHCGFVTDRYTAIPRHAPHSDGQHATVFMTREH